MDADGIEIECRVCRGEPEPDRPLFYPCMCSGSIGAVHQDCLEAWLDHSKKDTCELCSTKYEFKPQYAEGTPSVVPANVLVKSLIQMAAQKAIPIVVRIACAVLIWAVIVPVLTTCIYCVCVGRTSLMSMTYSWPILRAHIVHGINIDAVIALSLLILVSFTDFLRFHLVPVPPDQPAANGAAAADPAVAPAVPVAAPVAPAVPAPAPIPAPAPRRRGLVEVPHQEEWGFERGHAPTPPPWVAQESAPYAWEETEDELEMSDDAFTQQRGQDRALLTPVPPPREFYSRHHHPLNRPQEDSVPSGPDGDRGRESGNVEHVMEEAGTYRPMAVGGMSFGLPPRRPTGAADRDSSSLDSGDESSIDQDNRELAYNHDEEDRRGGGDGDTGSETESDSYSEESEAEAEDEEGFWHEERRNAEAMRRPPLRAANGEQRQFVNDAGEGAGIADMGMAGGFRFPENDFVFENNLDNDNADAPFDNAQEGGVEIRLALFELLGVEGPFHLMFRNSFWLLGFCSLYLFFSVMLPFVMGKMLFQVFAHNALAAYLLPPPLRAFLVLIQHHSGEHVPMQFLDFFYVSGGFSGIFSAVFLVDVFACAMLKLKLPNYVKLVLELIGKLSVVIKVGTLLLVRIFLLPLCLGTVMLRLAAPLVLPYSADQWAQFIALHSLGAFALAWVAGITFMLTMTITVLQLREVLHPDIFAKLIRPQEPHVDLISSLVSEAGHVHIRRVAISLAVYLTLMLLLVYVPLLQLVACCRALGVSPHFQFTFWYSVPEVQLPLELMLAHICFLSVLDTRKDVIGRVQHVVLVFLTERLGLQRMLIPFAQIRSSARNLGGDETSQGMVLGAPLRRPPAGWDIRNPQQSTRWAWGPEVPSAAEKNVAPRVIPADWLPRVVLLVLVCWGLANALTLFLFLVPVPLGRAALGLIYYPVYFRHDPLHFLVGCLLAATAASAVVTRIPRPDRWAVQWRRITGISSQVVLHVVVIEVLMALAYVSVGVLMRTLASQMLFLDMLTSPPGEVTTGSDAGLLSVLSGVTAADAIWYLGTCLLTGMATTHLLLAILTSRNAEHYFADIIEAEPPAGAPEVHWIAGSIHHLVMFLEYFKQLQKETTHALQDGDYSVEGLRLREIRNQLVVPFFTEVCGKGVVCSAVFAASVGLIAVKESLKLAEASFQLAVYAFAVQYLACMLYHPVRSAAKALHTRVMNSNYLVGRTLVNNPSKTGAAAQTAREANS